MWNRRHRTDPVADLLIDLLIEGERLAAERAAWWLQRDADKVAAVSADAAVNKPNPA